VITLSNYFCLDCNIIGAQVHSIAGGVTSRCNFFFQSYIEINSLQSTCPRATLLSVHISSLPPCEIHLQPKVRMRG